jgi:hypothetical protein
MTTPIENVKAESPAPQADIPNVLADTFAQFGLTGLYDGKSSAKLDAKDEPRQDDS